MTILNWSQYDLWKEDLKITWKQIVSVTYILLFTSLPVGPLHLGAQSRVISLSPPMLVALQTALIWRVTQIQSQVSKLICAR